LAPLDSGIRAGSCVPSGDPPEPELGAVTTAVAAEVAVAVPAELDAVTVRRSDAPASAETSAYVDEAAPEIAGAAVFFGAWVKVDVGAVTTGVAADVAMADAMLLVAVTLTRSVAPASADATV
jgi:hypothetical protein